MNSNTHSKAEQMDVLTEEAPLNSGNERKENLGGMPLRSREAVPLMVVGVLALVVLATLIGVISAAPGWYTRVVQGAAEQSALLTHVHSAPSTSTGLVPFHSTAQPAGRAHTTFLELQEIDLMPNVPLRFAGSGFLPGEALVVTVQNQQGLLEAQLAPLSADQAGQVSAATEEIPSDLVPGTHTLLMEGQSSHRVAQAIFRLHWIPPTVQLDTYTVKPGHDFGFSGSGFLPNELVEVRLSGPPGERLAMVRANAGGNVTGRVTVPIMPEGDYTLSFVGQRSQTPTSVGLNVLGFHPHVVLNTYAPSPHARLGFTGEDFVPNEEVLVYLNRRGGEPVVRIHTDASGRFVEPAAWEVGELSGENTLIFVGQESGAVVTATFTVVL